MIKVEQLVRNYGEVQALRGISFCVPQGQVCGYLGPNGAGKSTTVKILTGTLTPSSGSASVAGFDVAQSPLDVKRRIGYVPETGVVFETLSVSEYLTLVGTLHEMEQARIHERTCKLLELFQIAETANRRLDTLSKGMRQRVVISAALLHDPEVVLFDEPLSGLDAHGARVIKDLVRGLAQRGKTVLYCSHVLEVVERLCERVIILNNGQIVADGPTAEMISSARRSSLDDLFRELTAPEDQRELTQAFLDVLSDKEQPRKK